MKTKDVDKLAKKLNRKLTKPQIFRMMMSLSVGPSFQMEQDNYGQLIIYTGMKQTDKGYEVMTDEEFQETEEESEATS